MILTPPPVPTSYQGLAYPKSPPAAPPGGAGPPIIVGGLSQIPRLATPSRPVETPDEEEAAPSEVQKLLDRYPGPGSPRAPKAETSPEEMSREERRNADRQRLEEGSETETAEAVERRGLFELFGRRPIPSIPGRFGRRGTFGDNSRADSGMAPPGSGSAQAAASLGLLHSAGGVQGRAGLGFSGRRGGSLSSPDAAVRSGSGASGAPEPSQCLVPIDRRTGGVGARRASEGRGRTAAESLLPQPPTAPPGSAETAKGAPQKLSDGGRGGRNSEFVLQAAGARGEAQAAEEGQPSEAQPRVTGAAAGLSGEVIAGATSAAFAGKFSELGDSRPQLTWRDAPRMRMRRPGCNSFRSMEAFQPKPSPWDRGPGAPNERPEEEMQEPAPPLASARRPVGAASVRNAADPRAAARRGALGGPLADASPESGADGGAGTCSAPSFYPTLPDARPREVPGTTQPNARPGLPTFSPPDPGALEAQNPFAAREPEGQTPFPAPEGTVRWGPRLSDVEIGPPTGYDEKGKIQVNKGKAATGPRGMGGGGDGAELFAMGVALSDLAHGQSEGSRLAKRMESDAKTAARETSLAITARARAKRTAPEARKAVEDVARSHQQVADTAIANVAGNAVGLAFASGIMAAARSTIDKLTQNFRYDPDTLRDLARNAVRDARRAQDREIRRQASRERRPGYIAGQRAEAGRQQDRADKAQAHAKHYFDRANDDRLPARERQKALVRANHFAGQATEAYARTGRALEVLAAHEVRKGAGRRDADAGRIEAIEKKKADATKGLRRQLDETMTKVREVEAEHKAAVARGARASYEMADDVLATQDPLERRKAAFLDQARKLQEKIVAAETKVVEDAGAAPDPKGSKGASAAGGAIPKAAVQLVDNYRKQQGMNAAMAATIALQLAKAAYAKATDSHASEQERHAAVLDLEANADAAASYADEAKAASEDQPQDKDLKNAADQAAAKAAEANRLLAGACEALKCCEPPCVSPAYCHCTPKREREPESVLGGEGTSIAKHASGQGGLSEEELPLEPPGAARGDTDIVPPDAEASRTAEQEREAKTPDGSRETRTVAEPPKKPPPVDATSVARPRKPPPTPPITDWPRRLPQKLETVIGATFRVFQKAAEFLTDLAARPANPANPPEDVEKPSPETSAPQDSPSDEVVIEISPLDLEALELTDQLAGVYALFRGLREQLGAYRNPEFAKSLPRGALSIECLGMLSELEVWMDGALDGVASETNHFVKVYVTNPYPLSDEDRAQAHARMKRYLTRLEGALPFLDAMREIAVLTNYPLGRDLGDRLPTFFKSVARVQRLVWNPDEPAIGNPREERHGAILDSVQAPLALGAGGTERVSRITTGDGREEIRVVRWHEGKWVPHAVHGSPLGWLEAAKNDIRWTKELGQALAKGDAAAFTVLSKQVEILTYGIGAGAAVRGLATLARTSKSVGSLLREASKSAVGIGSAGAVKAGLFGAASGAALEVVLGKPDSVLDVLGAAAAGLLFGRLGAPLGGKSNAPRRIYTTIRDDFGEVVKSNRVWGMTEGAVYGMAKPGASRFRTMLGPLKEDPGRVVFTGRAAAAFHLHEFEGVFSGIKRLMGQHKSGFGDLAWDPAKAILRGRTLYVSEVQLSAHLGQTTREATRRLWARRVLDVGLTALAGEAAYLGARATGLISPDGSR